MAGQMARIGRRKALFLCAMGLGTLLSCCWFGISFRLTQLHEKDAQVINNAGRLRHYTDRIALVFLLKRLLPSKQVDEVIPEPFEQLQTIINGLLEEGKAENIPEALDVHVKTALIGWAEQHIRPLYDTYQRLSDLSEAELWQAVVAVNAATLSVDAIVDKASAASNGRVKVLLAVSIVRTVTGALWATLVAISFGSVWRPYIETYNKLQVVEQESASILRAAFDAVISVSSASPFNVIVSDANLDHLLGQPMLGKSVLECAESTAEKVELFEALSRAHGTAAAQASWSSPVEARCWWNLFPQTPLESLPVATMIRTDWLCGPHAQQPSVNLEVLVVNRSCSRLGRGDDATMLVLRSTCSNGAPATPEAGEAGGLRAAQSPTPWAGPAGAVSFAAPSLTLTHSSSSATTACVGPAVGAMTPHSELEDTPPPMGIGRLTAPHPQDEMYGSAAFEMLQEEVLRRLGSSRQEQRAGSESSGNRTPPHNLTR